MKVSTKRKKKTKKNNIGIPTIKAGKTDTMDRAVIYVTKLSPSSKVNLGRS